MGITTGNFLVHLGILLLLFHLSFSLDKLSINPKVIPVKDPNNITLTFGSCNSFYGNEPTDIFYRIIEFNPDVWIWLGDVAYLDLLNTDFPPRFGYTGEKIMKERFLNVKNEPAYKALRESVPVIGVWDDHDYGLNNAGKDFEHKDLTQQMWLDFIDEPQDSIRRKRKGIYESYYLGDPFKIKIILLDVRYFKDEQWVIAVGGTDILGDEQWEWLENELKENKAEYVIIASGSQIISDDRLLPETWYPDSRDRLINLIKKYQTGGVILLSGDVHYAEIMKYPCKERVGFELYEFTSSGLTHDVSTHVALEETIVSNVFPDTWNTIEDKYFRKNFGAIRFLFGENQGVNLEIRNFTGQVVIEKHIPYSDLKFDEKILDDSSECILDVSRYLRLWEHFKQSNLRGESWALVTTFTVIFALALLVILSKVMFTFLLWVIRRGSANDLSMQKSKRE